MRLGWLVRSHLLNKIEYLCEPRLGNACSQQGSEPVIIRMDAGRKPHGETLVPSHA